jgi:hypothetical protein
MSRGRQRWTNGLILGLALAAAGVLVLDSAAGPRRERARSFHELVGGLGFGPALDLERCEFSFDPRLCDHCSGDVGVVPGGMIFCPHHGLTVQAYPSLPEK